MRLFKMNNNIKIKCISWLFLLVLLLDHYCQKARGDDNHLVVMTFNILCSWCKPIEYDRWLDRIHYFQDIFQRHQPDLIGIQELMNAKEVHQLLDLNPAYSSLYYVDTSGLVEKNLCDAVIFYLKDRFEVIEYGVYWLSPTPDIPWTTGWAEAQLWRILIWAHLRQISDGRELYFASTHFDPNDPNQEMSAPLVLQRTEPWAKRMPAIVVGDFNTDRGEAGYYILTNGIGGEGFHFIDTFDIAQSWYIETNQSPIPEYDPLQKIDHIFLSEGTTQWRVPRWAVDMYVYGEKNRYPSDHYPIISEIEILNWGTPIPTPTPAITLTPTSTPTSTPTIIPTCTRTPTPAFKKPKILCGGFMDTYLYSHNGGTLTIIAITISDEFDPVDAVRVDFQGIPTGIYLTEQGKNVYFYQKRLEGILPKSSFLLELKAKSRRGVLAETFPYLTIK